MVLKMAKKVIPKATHRYQFREMFRNSNFDNKNSALRG